MEPNNISKDLEGVDVTQGKFQVSIGTSIAIETLFGLNDNIAPTKPLPYKKYGLVLFNVKTLIRNIYGAVTKELKTEWPASRYLEKVLLELEKIPMILSDQSNGKVSGAFYIATYKSLESKFPKAILKKVTRKAVAGQHYEAIEQYCVAQLITRIMRKELNISIIDCDLHPVEVNTAIVTHMPVDLLSYRHSTLVDLLESHTGVIKPRTLWYSKLNGKGLDRIPFDAWSIMWFGDGKTFTPYPPAYRRAVIALATEKKWNQLTTPRLIKAQLKYISEVPVRESLSKIL